MLPQAPRVLCIVFLLALGACGGDEPAIADEAWRVEETLRIGRRAGDGPDLFGSIRALAVDPAGRIWLVDQQARELRVFDSAGRFVRTVGRTGGGPGEFVYPVGLTWDTAGRLMVADPRNTRISVFDTSGAYVTSYPMQGGFTINPSPARMDTAGNFYNFAWGGRDGTLMVKFTPAMQPVDTLAPPTLAGEVAYFEYVSPDGNDRGRTPVPFTPRLYWRMGPAGDIWAVHTGAYRLLRFSADGDTLVDVTHPFDAVPVAAADADSALAELEEFRRLGGNVDASRIPGTKPPVETFYVAETGDVWVAVTTPDAPPRSVWDVFDSAGAYRARATLPFSVSIEAYPIIRHDRLYAVTEGPFDEQYIVVGHIVRGS